MRLLPILILLLALGLLYHPWQIADWRMHVKPPPISEELVEKGRYLTAVAGCQGCHTAPEAGSQPFAGGRALMTPFGTFYPPNITADLSTGIGNWNNEEFLAAMQLGLSPEGYHYYPAFPYPSYAGMTQDDLLAIKAYIFSLPATKQSNREHDLSAWVGWRPLLGIWKWRYFEGREFNPDPDASAAWNRGAYLVRHVAHCGECHTPRTWLGGPDRKRHLAGNPDGPDGGPVPDIRWEPEGIASWSEADLGLFLEMGMLPDGDFVGGTMADVVEHSTGPMTAEDRQAIVTYLRSLQAEAP